MPPNRPRPWILLPIILMWSLGATGALARSPGESPDASPSALDPLIEEMLAGALEDPAAIAAEEAAHRHEERAALGVAAIDPELPGIMDELDAIAAEVLGSYLAELPLPTTPDATDGRTTPPGQGDRGRPLAMLQATVGLNLTWGMAVVAATSFIGDWRPAPGTATLPGRPISTSGTFERGGRFTSYTTTLSDALRVDNGTIRLSYEFTMHSEVLDSTSNATVAGIDDRGRFAISINPCPAAGGRVDTIVESESDLTVRRPGGGSSSVREHAIATAVTTVTDKAEIGQTVTELTTRRTTSGSSSSDVGFTARFGADGAPTSTLTHDDGSDADLRAAAKGAAASALASVSLLVDAARKVWRARCVTVTPDPAGREVLPGSDTTISVTVHLAVEDRDIEVPVRATLEGVESIDPNDEPHDAPADIEYRAGTQPRSEGKVTFRSTSDRGLAERTETYRTGPRLFVDVDGDVDASLGTAKSRFTVTGRDLRVTFGPGDPPTVHLEGRVRISGRTSDPSGCRSDYSGAITVDPDGSARLVMDAEVPRLAVLLVPSDPAATVRVRARCPSGSRTSPFPAAALLGVWALARDPAVVDLPNGSTTVRVARSGATPKQTWTISVRPLIGD